MECFMRLASIQGGSTIVITHDVHQVAYGLDRLRER